MNFNNHSRLRDQHAFLGASNYHWIGYSEEKLVERYKNWLAVKRGTELHALAAQAIRLGVRLPDDGRTLNRYVNDAIDFCMEPEQILYYSENCFGTADTICFNNNILRIHDYKSGQHPASLQQLRVYDSLFCLEYGVAPRDILIENRIYQKNDINAENPPCESIMAIMDKIIRFDNIINEIKYGG